LDRNGAPPSSPTAPMKPRVGRINAEHECVD
jgi:hypothetical protein